MALGIKGTEQWIEVLRDDESEHWDWSEFRAWLDPATGRFYWGTDSGCSCNYFGDSWNSISYLEDGDLAALKRAIRAWEPNVEARSSLYRELEESLEDHK